jgi:hypothetical protein
LDSNSDIFHFISEVFQTLTQSNFNSNMHMHPALEKMQKRRCGVGGQQKGTLEHDSILRRCWSSKYGGGRTEPPYGELARTSSSSHSGHGVAARVIQQTHCFPVSIPVMTGFALDILAPLVKPPPGSSMATGRE